MTQFHGLWDARLALLKHFLIRSDQITPEQLHVAVEWLADLEMQLAVDDAKGEQLDLPF